MEDFEKLSLEEEVEGEGMEETTTADDENHKKSSKMECSQKETLNLLRKFLQIQQRRAQAYALLKRGFAEYMVSGGELAYQQLCSEITAEFNGCSKQVLELESLFLNPEYGRIDLAGLLRAVQTQEKQKLHLVSILDFSTPNLMQQELNVLGNSPLQTTYKCSPRNRHPIRYFILNLFKTGQDAVL